MADPTGFLTTPREVATRRSVAERLHDWDEVYPDTPLARRRLYTALSRAMHRVTVLAQGPLTPMLATR